MKEDFSFSKRNIIKLGLAGLIAAAAPGGAAKAVPSGVSAPFGVSNIPRIGRRLAVLADSKGALGWITPSPLPNPGNGWNYGVMQQSNVGFVNWTNRLLGQYFTPLQNFGVSGYDTGQLLANTFASLVAAASTYDTVWVDMGVNDVRHNLTTAQSMANIQAMIPVLLNLGKTVIWVLPPPCEFNNAAVSSGMVASVANARKLHQSLRKAIKEYIRSFAGWTPLVAVDPYGDLVDPASSTESFLASYSLLNPSVSGGDQIHPGAVGGLVGARRIASVLSPLIGAWMPQTHGPVDVYDATYNPYGNFLYNPGFATTTGGTGGGGSAVTGNVPSGWTASISGGLLGTDITLSYLTPTQGSGRMGNTMVITPSQAAGRGSFCTLQLRCALTMSSVSGLAEGQIVRGGVRIDLVNPQSLAEIQVWGEHNGTNAYKFADGFGDSASTAPGNYPFPPTSVDTLHFETPPYLIPPNSTTSVGLDIAFQWNNNSIAPGLAAGGAIWVSDPFLERLT
jgi:hypothetical protein